MMDTCRGPWVTVMCQCISRCSCKQFTQAEAVLCILIEGTRGFTPVRWHRKGQLEKPTANDLTATQKWAVLKSLKDKAGCFSPAVCSSARLLGICLCLPHENNNSLLLRNLPKCPLPTLTSPSFPSQRPNFYKRDSTKVTVSSTLIVIQPTIGPHFGFDFQITRPCNYKK